MEENELLLWPREGLLPGEFDDRNGNLCVKQNKPFSKRCFLLYTEAGFKCM